MTTTQIILVISLSALAVGSVFFLLSPPLQNETGIEQEVIQEPTQVVEIGGKPVEAYNFDKGESMGNYKVVDCYYKSQTPEVMIKKDDVVVNNVTGVPFVICISAGERKTGGYVLSLNNISINKDNFQIFIDLFLKVPTKGEMVTHAFTYPSIAVEINEVLDAGEWEVIVTIEQKNGEPIVVEKEFYIF